MSIEQPATAAGERPRETSKSAKRSILVVIPTLNEASTIEGVVEGLCDDLPADSKVSVMVVDGGSTDGTVEVVRRIGAVRPMIGFLHNPKRVQSAAVNLAARTVGHDADVLIRCDAHSIYPRSFVRRLMQTLDRTQADAVVVPMDSTGKTCLQRAVAWVSDTPVGSGGSAHRGGTRSGFIDHGHHAAFRMSSFRRADGYDETFTHNEDAEFDCRQRALGSRIYLDADIRLGYLPRSTWLGLWRQYCAYGRGRARTVQRHPGSLRARQLAVPLHLAVSAVALSLAPWSLLPSLWPAAYGLALAGTSAWLAIRQRAWCGLLAGPSAFAMHSAWALGFASGLLFVRESRWQPSAAGPLQADAPVGT